MQSLIVENTKICFKLLDLFHKQNNLRKRIQF